MKRWAIICHQPNHRKRLSLPPHCHYGDRMYRVVSTLLHAWPALSLWCDFCVKSNNVGIVACLKELRQFTAFLTALCIDWFLRYLRLSLCIGLFPLNSWATMRLPHLLFWVQQGEKQGSRYEIGSSIVESLSCSYAASVLWILSRSWAVFRGSSWRKHWRWTLCKYALGKRLPGRVTPYMGTMEPFFEIRLEAAL